MNHSDVQEFFQRFNFPRSSVPRLLPGELFKFRLEFIKEELKELIEAQEVYDLHKAADALIDLAYVIHGTAIMMGLPWEELWNEVHRANMDKELVKTASESPRGVIWDVIKPEGWKGPDFTNILGPDRVDN